MDHYVFFILNMIIFAAILIIDKKNYKDYIWLSAIGLVFAYVFETSTTYLGFWYYHSVPQIPLVSLYTWLLYVPYLSMCYYIGRRLA